MDTKYLKGATDESKDMLDFLLKYIDSHMVEVVGEKNEFVAYCEDEERGDMIFTLSAIKPNKVRENDEPNDGKATVDDDSEKEVES